MDQSTAEQSDEQAVRFGSVTPVFRMFDVVKAREFYVDYLGFSVEFEHSFGEDFPLYMGLKRNGLSLHLSEHHGDATPGSQVRVQVMDIEAFHAAVTSKPYRYLKAGLEEQPWGERLVRVTEPFGNRITFFQPK